MSSKSLSSKSLSSNSKGAISLQAMLLLAFVLIGLGVVVLPWLQRKKPMALPAVLAVEDPGTRQLLAVVDQINQACEQGDVQGVLLGLTPAHREQLQQLADANGRSLDSRLLQELKSLVESPGKEDFVLGRAGGVRAALVFRRPVLGIRQQQSEDLPLLVLPFVWDGHRFLLAPQIPQRLAKGAELEEVADRLAQRWITSPSPNAVK